MPTTSTDRAVPGLLFVMATLTVLATAVICLLIASPTWAMLPVALGAVAVGTVCVLTALRHVLAEDEPAEPAVEAAPAVTPATA